MTKPLESHPRTLRGFPASPVTLRGRGTIAGLMRSVQPQGGRSGCESGRRTRARTRCRDQRGAALVEMAIVSLFLFTMIFGIIDFGWAFMKNLDVRHGAREVGRLAAVNFDGATPLGAAQAQRLVSAACDRMDGDAATTVTLDLSAGASSVKVTVTQGFRGLTGFFDNVLPTSLSSSVTMRMEQTASFDDETPMPANPTPDTYSCS